MKFANFSVCVHVCVCVCVCVSVCGSVSETAVYILYVPRVQGLYEQ